MQPVEWSHKYILYHIYITRETACGIKFILKDTQLFISSSTYTVFLISGSVLFHIYVYIYFFFIYLQYIKKQQKIYQIGLYFDTCVSHS